MSEIDINNLGLRLDKRREELRLEIDSLTARMALYDDLGALLKLLEKYELANANLKEENAALREKNKRLELTLGEVNSILNRMAKQAADEAILKALRIYITFSRRKGLKKREIAKQTLREFVEVNKVQLTDDLEQMLLELDDDNSTAVSHAPNVYNIDGDYVENQEITKH